jgi:acyl carrier protein
LLETKGNAAQKDVRMLQNQDHILQRLTAVFRDVLDLDGLELKLTTTANDVEGWDSLAHVRLMVATEQEFKVRLTTVEVSSLKNVGELVSAIAEKTTAKAS